MKFTKILAVFGLFALGVIGASALASRAQLESELMRKSRDLLMVNGWSEGVQVSFRGRQCILTGVVSSEPERQQLLELVRGVDGVYELDAGHLVVSR